MKRKTKEELRAQLQRRIQHWKTEGEMPQKVTEADDALQRVREVHLPILQRIGEQLRAMR